MSASYRIAVLVGSLRAGSYNRKAALAMKSLAPSELALEIIEIGDLPLYNEDLEGKDKTAPETWTRFREAVRGCDGVLFFTPEYNRSVPGCLKNAIDVGSRPYGKSAWSGKPGGVVSVSPSAIGGFGANHALRQAMVFLDVPMMQQPEAYLSGVGGMFDESGRLTDDKTREFLTKFALAFAAWIDTLRPRTATAGT